MTYDTIAVFYDQAMPDYDWCEHFLNTIVDARLDSYRSVLELGCGTGRILELIHHKFSRSVGIDVCETMMEQAKLRLPETEFITQDMRSFSLDERFDLILCLFDSINHLHDFPEWIATLNRIWAHLAPRGICIFDMNTPQRLARLSLFPPIVREFGDDDLLLIDVVEDEEGEDGSGLFHFDVSVFKHQQDNRYEKHFERITEFAPPAAEVIAEVKRLFDFVEVYDEDEELVDVEIPLEEAENGRLFIVCSNR